MTALIALLLTAQPQFSMRALDMFLDSGINNSGQVGGDGFPSLLWDGIEVVKQKEPWHKTVALNDKGTLVGEAYEDGSYPAVQKKGSITRLACLPKHKEARALAVNADDIIVGESGAYFKQRPVIWKDGTAQDLGVLPGDNVGSARGINSHGVIVGYSSNDAHTTPVVFGEDTVEGLPLPAGMTEGGAEAINAKGTIVGWCKVKGQATLACMWIDRKPTLLGKLKGQYDSKAVAINEAGDVVGTSGPKLIWIGDGPGFANLDDTHGFLWRDGEMIDLTEIVTQKDRRLRLQEARGINDKGQIVGSARRDGTYFTIILSPMPATKKRP